MQKGEKNAEEEGQEEGQAATLTVTWTINPQAIFKFCNSKMDAPVSYKQWCISVLTIIIESIYIDIVKQPNNYRFIDL